MEKKQKICIILPGWITKNTGGAELQTHLISDEFVNRGWEVEVITYGTRQSIESSKKSKYFNSEIKYHYYSSRFHTFRFIELLYILLFKSNSSIFYLRSNAIALKGALTLYSKIFTKKITIYALAGDDETQITTIKIKKISYTNIKNLLLNLDKTVINFFSSNANGKMDVILSQTYFQKKELKKHQGLDSFVVRNSFKYLDYKTDKIEKENIVLWVANFRKVKQPDKFVKLASEFMMSGWRFIMIGRNNDYNFHINKTQNLEILGELSYSDTNKWFQKSKILINTSKFEGFSNTFISAWMYKTTIISLNVNPDRLLSDKNMGLYADGDERKLTVLLQETMNNKFSIDLNYCKKKCIELFDLNNNFKQIESIIDNQLRK